MHVRLLVNSARRRSLSMTTSRRDFIVGTGAAIALANLPARAAGDADAAAEKLLAEIAEELLVDYPETATSLGIDKGKRAALKSKLSDRSAAGQTSDRAARREAAGALEGHRHLAPQRSSAHRCGRRAHGA